jgi:hypothetical protein
MMHMDMDMDIDDAQDTDDAFDGERPAAEKTSAPVLPSVGMAFSTFAAAGVVDVAAHLGPTGVFLGVVGAIVAYRHGPQTYAWLHEHFPALPLSMRTPPAVPEPLAVAQRCAPPTDAPTRRSLLDRAFGRFPVVSEKPPHPHAHMTPRPDSFPPSTGQSTIAMAMARAAQTQSTSPLPRPQVSGSEAPARPVDTRLHLAQHWHPDIEEVIGSGFVCYGVKGSGKTNTGALLAEQIGRRYVPFIIFDLEGDYQSVIEVVPNGYLAGKAFESEHPRYLTITQANAFDMAEVMLSGGYQVVVDLSSYDDDEMRAAIITDLVSGLMRYAERLPNEQRVPCLVFYDEASRLFPQQASMSYLAPATQNALTRAVYEMVTMGRKRGIIPAFFTQRPADFDKRIASQADLLILMRQRQDVDVQRYKEYLGKEAAEAAASLGLGEGFVIPSDGKWFRTTFYPRQSRHSSNTPKAETAYRLFAHPGRVSRPAHVAQGSQSRMNRRTHFIPLSQPQAFPSEPQEEEDLLADLAPLCVKEPGAIRQNKYECALQAWNGGARSIRKLSAELGLNFNQARDIIDELHHRGLINKYEKEPRQETV